ncbi:MAG: hypothetical protein MHPSP_000348, partial [Paramarteilia canceri]
EKLVIKNFEDTESGWIIVQNIKTQGIGKIPIRILEIKESEIKFLLTIMFRKLEWFLKNSYTIDCSLKKLIEKLEIIKELKIKGIDFMAKELDSLIEISNKRVDLIKSIIEKIENIS